MIRCKQKTVKNAARLVNQLKKKEYLLSISEMKNILKNQSKEELIKLVTDSYKAIPQLKEYITIRYAKQDEIEQIAEAYKNNNLEEFDIDQSEMKNIKEYISNRLRERKDIPDLNNEKSIDEVISYVIDSDEIFLSKMESQGFSFSSDDEYDFIQERTGYSFELVEFILWQRYCYEMENDYWTYDRDKCRKCDSSELYLKEVPNVDFADKVVCKLCGTEFIRN